MKHLRPGHLALEARVLHSQSNETHHQANKITWLGLNKQAFLFFSLQKRGK